MKTLRIAVALMLVAGLMVGVTGCSNKDVAAKVNGEVIKMSDLDAQIAKLKENYPSLFSGADGEGRLIDFKQRLLDNMINTLLIRQAAKEAGVEVTDADVDKKIEELRAGFQTQEQFDQTLQQAGMDLEGLKEQIRNQLESTALIKTLNKDTEVTDKEIEDYYNKNKLEFADQASIHVAHILFDANDKATAEKVLAELKAGGDFAALAKKYSKDTVSASNGGDLGWPTTPYVPEFSAAAEALKPGEISGLVKTEFGWHIIKMIEKRTARQKTLEEVKDQIKQMIIQQRDADAYQKYLDELRKKADIEILVPELQNPSGASTETSSN